MAESENKRLITRYYEEVLNQGKLDVLDAIARSDHVEHNPFPGQAQGLDGLKQRVGIIKTAFNPKFTLEPPGERAPAASDASAHHTAQSEDHPQPHQ